MKIRALVQKPLIYKYFAVLALLAIIVIKPIYVKAVGDTTYISTTKNDGYFTLTESGKSTPLFIDSKDFPGVIRALNDLKTDIGKVTDKEPSVILDKLPDSKKERKNK